MQMHFRIALLVSLAMIPGTPVASQERTASRREIVPLVDHHQHIAGPAAVAFIAPPPPPATITLPADLADVLQRRGRASGTTDISLYAPNAQILDVSEAEDHWVRGRERLERMVSAYSPGTSFVPNYYISKGPVAFIAGVVRTAGSQEDEMHFMLGLRKDVRGAWRIETEYATNKPPLEYARPVTADKTIQVMDDAGIQRAVLLSLGYWFGDGQFKGSVEQEYAAVRRETDWVVSQASRYPGRFVVFCGVNPLRPYAIDELRRCSSIPGVKGMKLHFANSHIDVKMPEHVEALKRFFREANARRMAIVAHLWTFDYRQYGRQNAEIFLSRILPEAPDITVQIAHLAGAGRYAHDDVTEYFANAISANDPRLKNVYFDMATVVTEQQSQVTLDLIARRVRQIGLERILFGADTPLENRPPPMLAWATLKRRLPLIDDEIRVIARNVAPYF